MTKLRAAVRGVYACLSAFPSYHDYIYPADVLPPGRIVGYAPADLSSITFGSDIRMAELTRALRIATFHGRFPERLAASLMRGGRRAKLILFFNYLPNRERRALSAFRKPRQKWILDVHDIPHLQQLHFGVEVRSDYRDAFQTFARECDTLLFPSESLARMFMEEVEEPSKRIIVPNAANPEKFAATPLPADKVFTYVGGYAPARGIERLIQAFRILRRRRNDVGLWLAMPSDARLPLTYLDVEGLKVIPNITYDHGVVDLLRMSYAVVVPHDKNPYMDAATPIKVFEAMSSARPLVVTDCYETAKIVAAEKCGVITPCDENRISEAMDALANNPADAEDMGVNGRRAVENRHSWAHRAETISAALGLIRV
jgi:glycosyltransferase involved in cell wall biosynthesis